MDKHSDSRAFPHTATQAAFLLGGIGTGNFSIGSRGEFRDWELFNKPAKGQKFSYSFFALSCRGEGEVGGRALVRVLEAPVQGPYTDPTGLHSGTVAGLPHLKSARLRGEYPFALVDFQDDELPLSISMESFTPFIPLDADDSGLPCAVLRYKVKNESAERLEVSIVGSLPNVVGFSGFDPFGNLVTRPGARNEYRDEEKFRGLFLSSTGLDRDDLARGSLALITTDIDPTYRSSWLEGGWFDGIQDFWDDFRADGKLSQEAAFEAPGGHINSNMQRPLMASLGVAKEIEAGETAVFTFAICWNFPNRPRAWDPERGAAAIGNPPVVKNRYALRFPDAWAVGAYLFENLDRLEGLSRAFRGALYGSTLPPAVLDALAANITVIRSSTCFRLEDGTFVSWEGCFDHKGVCEGSCTHVWNYAQTLGFLFPELESTMLRVAFDLETDDEGRMAFRSHRVFGLPRWDMVPAADGQLGSIIRLYRDWKLRGDEAFLASVWPKAAKCIDFAMSYWDTDGDFILDGEQHNTYDIEFHGPNSFTSLIFYAALKAGAEIAAHLGEVDRSARYRAACEAGSRLMDETLWNGEYYVQRLEDVDAYRYQYGQGCLSDQLFGQSLANLTGLGYLVPRDHVRSALMAIYGRNFRRNLRDHSNTQRTYALESEGGLLLCTWPRGGRPRLPFVYCDEVWSGVEYQVASHLLHEGFIEEGLELVETVRERYDGVKRNPWNEIECGHHYVRSMASWGLLIALSGFEYDIPGHRISFSPKTGAGDFSAFFSTGAAWGVYRQRINPATGERSWEVEVLYGSLDGITVNEGKGT
jgi:non-lysosomal glucosylceramidase